MADKKEKKYLIDNPTLMAEWNWEKNNKLGLDPKTLTLGSNKKVWWICKSCGYEWLATPNSRQKSSCPCCAGRVVVKGINDLETLFPKIAKRWHPTKNKKKPYEFTAFSNQIAWWICDKDNRHIFDARINHITKGEIICPICVNQRIIDGINDFQTTNLDLMAEWNWEKNDKLNIYPTRISRGYNKKVWWKCANGHEWMATVASRTGEQKCGCPICKKEYFTSFPEKAIAYYLSDIYNVEENKKFNWLGNAEIDIYIDELKLGIEFDGAKWHQDYMRDYKKDILCYNNDINLIRVREIGCPNYQSSTYKITTRTKKVSDLKNAILEIIKFIELNYEIKNAVDIDVLRDYSKILAKITSGIKQKSVSSSKLIKEWNYDKNGDLSPKMISLGSDKKVWWKCSRGHEWQAAVSSRTGKQKCGCPYCTGQKVLSGENDLQTLYPKIAKEWDYEKNIKKPNQIRPMDNRKYWWLCSKCGESYQSTPNHRVGRNSGCPKCARIKTISSHYKKIINVEQNTVYNSIKEASIKLRINASSISNCCSGKSNTAGGYHWKFVED